jgi:hypothetical protein
MRFQKSSDGTTYTDWLITDFGQSEKDDWTYFSIDGTIPSDGSVKYAIYRILFANKTGVIQHFDDLSFKDITEANAAQKAADDAQSTANTAVSQTSTLSQDLSGFKTSVGQTYETKTDSTAKATTAQQNLDGFKTSVASTYASKTDVANTYATKSDVTQTSDSLTSQISAVGTDATSALNKATTNQQNLDGFKNTVSSTYATKSALDSTNGNVSNAQNAANQALANAQELVVNGGFENGLNSWSTTGSLNTDPNNSHSGNNSLYVEGMTVSINVSSINIRAGRTYQISFWGKGASAGVSYSRLLASSDGNIWNDDFRGPDFALTTDWKFFSFLYTTSDNANKYVRAKVVANVAWMIDDVSIKDITEVAQLQSDVAATYATQSSVQQTSSQITQQVAATYATKGDVTSKYTTLQQTDSAFDARIGTAQSRVETIETLIHSDANGVRVGKTVNGSYTGYSALVNANGSFDVLDPGGGVDARVNSDGMQLLNPLTGSLMNANRMIFGGLSIIETNVLNTAPTNIPSGGGLTPWKDFGSLRNPDGSIAQIMSPTGKLLCLLSVVDKVSATSSTVANGSDVRSIALNVNLTLEPQTGSTTGGQPTDVWNPVPAIVDLPNAGQSYYHESRPFVGLLNVSPNTIYYPHFSLRSVHSTAGSHYAQCGYRSLVLLPIT